MPDNNTAAPIGLAEGFNPFSDDAPQVQPQVPVEGAPTATEGQVTDPVVPQGTPDPVQDQTPQFDPNQFMKEKFGFDSVEQAEQEFQRLKEPKKDFEFESDTSKSLFNAIKEGKVDDVYEIISQQKRLEKLTTSEINANLAMDIIKTNISNKYKELAPDEVDLLFYENYGLPAKPEQGYDESDDDYESKVKQWENTCGVIEKRMIIEAKVLRPELEKLKSDLKLPDIYGEAQAAAKSQEEFENLQKARTNYEQALETQFNSFGGFNVSVKDEDVEIPIAFNVADDEKLQMKDLLSDFDAESFLEEQWFDKNGNPKVTQMMEDLYLLKNRQKIFQKVANEAASQRLLHHLKKTGNYTLNQPTPQGTPTPNANSAFEALQQAVWS